MMIVTTSWDDGLLDDVRLTELLSKYNIKGTLYISKGGEKWKLPRLMNEEQIKEVGKYCEIGAHTMNHPDLTRVSPIEATIEIVKSKNYLENLLGREVMMFCYPLGKFNKKVATIVKSNGFIGARTCVSMGLGLSSNPYKLPISLTISDGSPKMALKVCLRYRLKPSSLFDWESRLKILFDKALEIGGVYHIYGHSYEIADNNWWNKLESVLSYISGREAQYLTNGELICKMW